VNNPSDDRFSKLWQPAENSTLEHLSFSLDDGTTGFDLRSFPASTWLIHAMYETDIASLVSRSDESLAGVGLGWSEAPGEPYRRIRWRDYATRNGAPILVEGQWPGHRGFRAATNDASWPENVRPPAEGSIDKEGWRALTQVLEAHSPEGGDTECIAFYTPWALRPDNSSFLLRGRLAGANALAENPASIGSPQNFWPLGLQWFVYTDYDLQASRISGSPELIEALLASSELDCENLGGVAA
jgi:hypothetical protein